MKKRRRKKNPSRRERRSWGRRTGIRSLGICNGRRSKLRYNRSGRKLWRLGRTRGLNANCERLTSRIFPRGCEVAFFFFLSKTPGAWRPLNVFGDNISLWSILFREHLENNIIPVCARGAAVHDETRSLSKSRNPFVLWTSRFLSDAVAYACVYNTTEIKKKKQNNLHTILSESLFV